MPTLSKVAGTMVGLALSGSALSTPCGSDLALPLLDERTGHVSAELTLNGRPARMLVDTGANVSTLDKTQAVSHGVTVEQGAGLPPGEGRGKAQVRIANTSFGVQQFSVMDLHFINIPSQQYGTPPFAGQLGASFFKEFGARILFTERLLCLSRKP